MRSKRITYPLVVPAVLILLSALLVWKWPGLAGQVQKVRELRALLLIMPLVPYALFIIGIIVGWRFNNAGIILTACVLGLTYFGLSHSGPGNVKEGVVRLSVREASSVLVFLNLSFFATLTRRRLFTAMGLFCLALIAFQGFVVILMCQPASVPVSQLLLKIKRTWPLISNALDGFSIRLQTSMHGSAFFGLKNISTIATVCFAFAFIFLFRRFMKSQDALSAGFIGTLAATLLGLAGVHSGPSPMTYFSAAGLILIISSIESSFSMAYMDELTGLPGRRSLNEILGNLGRKYAIAMIDIDRFKRFNDKYGHKTGDQVLKMIASKLKDITGGAKVFRYGGEEFTAIFPGKVTEEVVPHLEVYRKIVESTPFIIREKGRRKGTVEERGKSKSGGLQKVKVTVSIGVAAPGKELTTPEKVLKAADKVLYKAKKTGRNRVES